LFSEKNLPAISVRHVTRTYDGGVEALRGVTLDLAAGRVTAAAKPLS